MSAYFRRRRDKGLRKFILAQRGQRTGSFRILDVGGSAGYWQRVGSAFLADNNIDVLCVNPLADGTPAGLTSVTSQAGDGRDLPFPDMSFDMVHANSVIEHVGRSADMLRFANEVRRLAPAYYVQTPDFWFPVDPHFYRVPFFHWLPEPIRVVLVQNVRVGLHPPQPDIQRALSMVEYAVPLDRRHLCALFPDAEVISERVFFISKSLIALRPANPALSDAGQSGSGLSGF